MVKVLHLRSSTSLGGPEKQILRAAKSLRLEGFDLTLLVLYRRNDAMPFFHPLVVEARKQEIPAEQMLDSHQLPFQLIGRIAKKLKEEQFSLVHTHEYRGDIVGGMAARLAGVKAVAVVRGYTDRTLALRLYKILDLLALRFFAKIITVSTSLRRQVMSAGLPKERVVTIHNAIAPESLEVEGYADDLRVREGLGIEPEEQVVSIVGRLSPEKGHIYLFQAIKKILAALPKTRLLVIGDGPLREKLEILSVSLGLGSAVSFLGFRQDVVALMKISDMMVLPSLREGLPNVILEALALAKPVVATQVGGIPEIIRDGETGLLVPPKDPERLAEALLHLLRNPEKGKEFGERGKAIVTQEFNVETMVHKIAEVYREVLSSTG
jgi:glycosyltransferase involved in cell wall biosynthesis